MCYRFLVHIAHKILLCCEISVLVYVYEHYVYSYVCIYKYIYLFILLKLCDFKCE